MHLIHALQQKYQLTVDWEGQKLYGFTFVWQYSRGHVDVSMSNYIPQLLKKSRSKSYGITIFIIFGYTICTLKEKRTEICIPTGHLQTNNYN